ncbi:hypothetical protein FRC06_003489, partial [Ceratobasidium sp. 370]
PNVSGNTTQCSHALHPRSINYSKPQINSYILAATQLTTQDEYEASSRGSSRPPSPAAGLQSKSKRQPKWEKYPFGKRSERPRRIKQPLIDTGTTSHGSSPEPPTTPGPQRGNHLMASRRSTVVADKAEAIHQASAFLGTDASRLPARIIQDVLAEISNTAEETQESPMELEGGSAPAVLQSARGMVLGSQHQPSTTGAPNIVGLLQQPSTQPTSTNDPFPPNKSRLEGPPDLGSATESESEPEPNFELGPGDSVSQRLPPAPLPLGTTTIPSRPPPTPLSFAARYADKTKRPDERSDTATVDESEDSDRDLRAASTHKRRRLTDNTSSTSRYLPPHSTSAHHRPPIAPHDTRTTSSTHHSAPVSSLDSLEPPPSSDLSAVLIWAAQLAKQLTRPPATTDQGTAGSSCQADRPGQPGIAYGLVTKVLEKLRSDLATTTREPQVPAQHLPSQSSHTDFVEDDATILEAEAALELGRHLSRRRKPSLADFPGLPRRIATLAMPELIAVACTQGAYEVFGTLCDWADDTYKRVWARELGNLRLQKAPHALKSIMVHRVSWFRGDLKVRVRPVVQHAYPFINPPRSSQDLLHNRELAKRILPNVFHCRDINNPNDNQYEHLALSDCIATSFFWGPDSVGMIHRDRFQPVPIPAIAMVLTTMQHCIKEWKTGRFVALQLNTGKQYRIYEVHLKGLLAYAKSAPKQLSDFQAEWFRYSA